MTNIGEEAFFECSGLTSIGIPSSVTSIDDYAFSGCSGLTSIVIPTSVISIGSGVLGGCNDLTDIKVPITDLSAFCNNKTLELISSSIGKPVMLIDNDGKEMKDIIIPSDVTSIGNSAFNNCSNITSIIIPNSVTSIGQSAFSGCSGLTSVTIHSTEIGCWFSGLINIKEVILGEKVSIIGSSAFSGCSGLTSVTIPNSVTSIGEYAFYNCKNLTSTIIGSGVTSIGNDAFSNTNLVKSIWLTNTPPTGALYAQGTINYVANEEYNINNKVVYPFLSSYFDVDGIRYVPVSPSDKTCDAIDCVLDERAANTIIGPTVTYKGITMTVKKVMPYIGYNNKYIEKLTVDNDGALGYNAFTNCSNIKTVRFGEKLSDIGSSAFNGCSSIESVIIPNSVETINEKAFYGCSALRDLKIGSKVSVINQYAFYGCEALPSVTIPQSVKEINNSAFEKCTNLTQVIISDSELDLKLGSNYTYYNYSPLFESCPLDSVYIGRNINYNTSKDYGYSPFYRNTTLRAVKITDKETEISENEFYGCTNLQRVIIGDGVTTIGNWAFSGCSSLKFFTFGSEVKTIGQEAFSDCSAVTEITSRAIEPPTCGTQALDDINKWECKLYVPIGHLKAYQEADQWKDFFFAEEGDYTIAAKYTLTYMVDGEVYKTYQVAEGSAITPEEEPTKPDYVFSGWSPIPATMPSEDVTITGTFSLDTTEKEVITIKDTGKGTYCSEYDLDFTNVEGIRAYIAYGYDDITNTIWVTRVTSVPAGTGIMLKGDPGEYKIPHATVRSVYANYFKGNIGSSITINETDGDMKNYYMKNGQFVSVTGSVNIGANRCYLQLPISVFAGTRSIGIVYDDEEEGTTGIMDHGQWIMDKASDGWYTISGQRISQPTKKGLYIKDGKKVVIK